MKLPLALAALTLAGCATPGGDIAPVTAWVQPAQAVRHGVDADTLYRTGRYLQGMDRLAQAAQAYREVLAIQPAHVDALNALGVLHAMQGQDAQAEQSFRLALSHAPAAAHVLNNLGYHLMRSGRHEEALRVFERAQASEPLNSTVASNLVQVRARLAANQALAQATDQAAAEVAAVPAPAIVPAPVAVAMVTVESVPAAPLATPLAAPVAVAPTTPTAVAAPATDVRLEQVAEQVWVLRAPMALPGVPAPAQPVAVHAKAAPGGIEVYPRHVAAAPLAEPAPVVALQRVEIANGNGRTGLAQWVSALLGAQPQARPRLTNDPPYGVSRSRIEYVAGAEQMARDVNAGLPVALPYKRVPALARDLRVRVLLGHDFPPPKTAVKPQQLAQATPAS